MTAAATCAERDADRANRTAPAGTIMAFDFGARRIGVAVGETSTGQAHPLTVIPASDKAARYAAISALIAEWRPALLVVGLPLGPRGEEHETVRRCRRFADGLRGRFGLQVEFVDEAYSSASADSALRESGLDWQRRRDHVDATAAQLILQDYLDATARR
jgi:putative Holliday junction resolvase